MKRSYFAGANTTNGFVSYYDKIFGPCDNVYIIKGGSGTGKSRLMKELADDVEKNGNSVEYFYCSFDPASLDGIIIDGNVAVIDGTSPHVFEPTLPGAKENLVDLGAFWDPCRLRDKKSEIEGFILNKKRCFNIAYSLLGIVGELDKACYSILKKYIKWDRLNAESAKLISEIKPYSKGGFKVRLTSSMGMRGRVSFDSFKDISQKEIKICDRFGLGYLYLDSIRREAERFGASITVSYHPLFAGRIDELIVGDEILFTLDARGDETHIFDHIPDGETDHVEKLRMDMKLYEEKAKEWLRRASDIHFEIEKLYISAMDFDKKEAFTADFIKEIKKCLCLDKK